MSNVIHVTNTPDQQIPIQNDGPVFVDFDVVGKTITQNGTYNAADENADGYNPVVVNVKAKTKSKTINENGAYYAFNEGVDGYIAVVVNVPPYGVGEIEITENGTHDVSGKATARVNVPTYEEELATEQAMADGIVSREITAFSSDSVRSIGAQAFYFCRNLVSVHIPLVTTISTAAFAYCGMTEMELPSVANISATAFNQCNKLAKVVIRSSEVCSLLNANAFSGTPIAQETGYIYVPDKLVDAYQTADNWSTYAAQIKPISELEE